MTEETKKHVRPTRRKVGKGAAVSCCSEDVEGTSISRLKIESWTGTGGRSSNRDEGGGSKKSTVHREVEENMVKTPPSSPASKPVGILRKSKYSVGAKTESSDVESHEQRQQQAPLQSAVTPAAVRDVVVERRKPRGGGVISGGNAAATAQKPSAVSRGVLRGSAAMLAAAEPPSAEVASAAVEGCAPRTAQPDAPPASCRNDGLTGNTENGNHEEEEPLVFNSLADMMAKAGTLPTNNPNEPPSVVEAELSFSCMDPAEYEEQLRGAEDDAEEPEQGGAYEDEEEDEGGLLDLLQQNDDDEEVEHEEERAFLKLWAAISEWITPEAVAYVQQLRQNPDEVMMRTDWMPQFDRSDIGASRCAGFMSLLRMHTTRCLQDLGRSPDEYRSVEKRLADLLRCFDYSQPTPQFDTALTRAMTCVLLDTVTCDGAARETVPECCQAIGIVLEEYHYLTRSAILNFGASTDG
jgi:hypothetical protein